jgi:hypothetical protein
MRTIQSCYYYPHFIDNCPKVHTQDSNPGLSDSSIRGFFTVLYKLLPHEDAQNPNIYIMFPLIPVGKGSHDGPPNSWSRKFKIYEKLAAEFSSSSFPVPMKTASVLSW